MINVSSDIVESISTNASPAIQDLWPVFALLLGIILTFYIARRIIFLFSLTKR
jgi:hypothetical protein